MTKYNIGFVGLGKLGLPVAVALESKGHRVIGYDKNPDVKKYIEDKKIPYEEIYMGEMFPKSGVEFKEFAEVVSESDIIFVPVQTPHEKLYEGITRIPETRKDFDYTFLISAIRDISIEVDKGGKEKVVVIISTVLPGTIEKYIKPVLSPLIKLCYNPFFIAMGTVIQDLFDPEFVLLGVDDKDAAETVKNLYSTLHDKHVFETTVKNAELIKVAYNTFIGMKIVFANTMMEICHKIGGDVDAVIDALSLANQRLISARYLRGGMGDSGQCHPRDGIAMSYLAESLDLSHDLFSDIMLGRERQTEWLADLCLERGKKICILGKAYKPNINLQAGSCSILLLNLLKERGIESDIFDPLIDGEESFYHSFWSCEGDTIFFIGAKHDFFQKLKFPKGCTVIDPFRYIDDDPEINLIKIGQSK